MERVGVACDEGIAEVLRLTGPGKAQEITEAYLPVGHRAGEESALHTHTQLCLGRRLRQGKCAFGNRFITLNIDCMYMQATEVQ
jgi:hypothetical protein